MKITKKIVVDFLKDLEKSGMIQKGCHNDSSIVAAVKEAVIMPYEEVAKLNKPSISFFNTEFSDWIETYQAKAA